MALSFFKMLMFVGFAISLAQEVRSGLELISCQQGFIGEFLPEVKQAITTCAARNLTTNCNNYCMSAELKILAEDGFNFNTTAKLMTAQLAGPGGQLSVHNIFFRIQECDEYSNQLTLPCDNQVEFWNCIDKALACPPRDV